MSLSIDGRFENTHLLASNIKNFSVANRQNPLKDKNHILLYLLQLPGRNTPEHSSKIAEELETIQATALLLPYKDWQAFDVQVMAANNLKKLILCWRNFNSLKALISSLCELALVFPTPDNDVFGDFNRSRNELRDNARELMPLNALSMERFEEFSKLSEGFLALVHSSIFDDCEELIEEYTQKHDELYCEALIALT